MLSVIEIRNFSSKFPKISISAPPPPLLLNIDTLSKVGESVSNRVFKFNLVPPKYDAVSVYRNQSGTLTKLLGGAYM
jgi:hypothetical protein